MKKLLPILLLACSVTIFGQNATPTPSRTCELTLDQSPAIRGLKLGMLNKDFEGLFPERLLGRDRIYPGADLDGFDGVAFIEYEFFDKKLITFRIQYSQPFETPQLFAQNLSENLSLPLKAWYFYSARTGTMLCSEFSVRIESGGGPSIKLVDTAGVQSRDDAIEKERLNRQKKFKP